jgi:adenylyl-sulfate kinase
MDAQPQGAGFVIWITGMNGSGKTALASQLQRRLSAIGRPTELVDADDPEHLLTKGLGGSKDDRDVAVRRVGYLARAVARAGGIAVVAALSPYREPREQLRREIRRFFEVFADAKMEVLQKRDPIYRRALAGEVRNVPGVDDPYEPPTHPDAMVQTDEESVEEAAKRIFQALVDVKYLSAAEFMRLSGGERPKRARPAAKAKRGAAATAAAPARSGGGRGGPKAAARKAPKKLAARTAARVKRR